MHTILHIISCSMCNTVPRHCCWQCLCVCVTFSLGYCLEIFCSVVLCVMVAGRQALPDDVSVA